MRRVRYERRYTIEALTSTTFKKLADAINQQHSWSQDSDNPEDDFRDYRNDMLDVVGDRLEDIAYEIQGMVLGTKPPSKKAYENLTRLLAQEPNGEELAKKLIEVLA